MEKINETKPMTMTQKYLDSKRPGGEQKTARNEMVRKHMFQPEKLTAADGDEPFERNRTNEGRSVDRFGDKPRSTSRKRASTALDRGRNAQ